MRYIKFTLISVIFLMSISPCMARVEDAVTWITGEWVVTTEPNAVIYELPDRPEYFAGRIKYNNDRRETVDYSCFMQKTIKKPKVVVVRGFANKAKQLLYDTYVIEFKGRLYFLPCIYVADNNVIDAVNSKLTSTHSALTSDYCIKQSALDSLVSIYTNVFESKYEYYKSLKGRLPAMIDSVEHKVQADYEALQKAEYDTWYANLPKSTKNAYSRIFIDVAELQSPNSAGGCDYYFNYVNNSDKTIKYLRFTGSFYNAVNDPVSCDIRGYSTYTGKETGPVAHGESGGGSWGCVIYDWAASELRLENISITYMDGSSANIGTSDIRRLLECPYSFQMKQEFEEKHGDLWSLISEAAMPYRKQLVACDEEISKWWARLHYMHVGDYGRQREFLTEEYDVMFKELYDLFLSRNKAYRALFSFERNNLLGKEK